MDILASKMTLEELEAAVLSGSQYGDPDSSLHDWLAHSDLSTETIQDIISEWDAGRIETKRKPGRPPNNESGAMQILRARIPIEQMNWLNAHPLGKSAAVRQAIDDAMKAEWDGKAFEIAEPCKSCPHNNECPGGDIKCGCT